jgi:hypothetical protein
LTLSLAQSDPRMTNVETVGWRSNPYDLLTHGTRRHAKGARIRHREGTF